MIGKTLSTGSAVVDAEHVAAFARALRDPNPAYHGPDATTAPLTYPIAFMAQAMAGGTNTFLELDLNFMTLVHGEPEAKDAEGKPVFYSRNTLISKRT